MQGFPKGGRAVQYCTDIFDVVEKYFDVGCRETILPLCFVILGKALHMSYMNNGFQLDSF